MWGSSIRKGAGGRPGGPYIRDFTVDSSLTSIHARNARNILVVKETVLWSVTGLFFAKGGLDDFDAENKLCYLKWSSWIVIFLEILRSLLSVQNTRKQLSNNSNWIAHHWVIGLKGDNAVCCIKRWLDLFRSIMFLILLHQIILSC